MPGINEFISNRWDQPGGYRAVLKVAFPLILSTGMHTIQMFIDSIFLMHSSQDEMAASSLAGLTSFASSCLFFGIIGYISTFVAQYTGAKRPRQVGPSIWQGFYLATASWLLLLCLIPLAPEIFNWAGHNANIRQHEITYFRIMTFGTLPILTAVAASSFFNGRSKTWTVMAVHVGGNLINITLDYALIFGNWGFPEWGIKGAAWATVIANTCCCLVFLGLFLLPRRFRSEFNSLSGWRLNLNLMKRLIRFGGPNGLHFMLDIMAFNFFMTFVGRISPEVMTACSIGMRINMLAFMPMIGFGMAVSILVGQALGDNNPTLAKKVTWSATEMSFVYMTIISLGYWFTPDLFLIPFKGSQDLTAIRPIVVNLMAFIAVYCLFDVGNITFSATLRGAGDTRFVMYLGVTLAWVTMVLPTWLAVTYGWGPGNGLYLSWTAITFYVCLLAVVFLLRFLKGKWTTMRVIEPEIAPPPLVDIPAVDAEP